MGPILGDEIILQTQTEPGKYGEPSMEWGGRAGSNPGGSRFHPQLPSKAHLRRSGCLETALGKGWSQVGLPDFECFLERGVLSSNRKLQAGTQENLC